MMIINLVGILLIITIVWWFWLYKQAEVDAAAGTITVIVENGTYAPSRIRLPVDKPVTIRFQRKDASPCAGTVVFPDFEISEELPLNKSKDIQIPALAKGKYTFSCQMQMYRGELVVGE